MKPYELAIICDSLHLRHKESWEQARMVAYITAQANSSKRLKPSDIITFPWEKENEDTQASVQNKPLTNEDVEAIKAAALDRERQLKEKGII